MSRPAIIIGLGGTGQWVLTFIKKDLLEINHGKMPDNVKLLAFDTMPQATAEMETVKMGKELEVKAGAVKLETGTEFIHLGGNLFNISKEVAAGKHRHLGVWYDAEYWLRTLPPGAFDLASGAGAIRQFGRAAVFNDLAQPASSALWSRLSAAVNALKLQVNDRQKLEVIVVGSFAGGTGAGMFVDVANLLRAVSEHAVSGNHLVRGIFVLPRVFGVQDLGPATREMMARSFAAWRELDRFMLLSDRWGLRRISYHDRVDSLQLTIQKRPFDVCYLVDGSRQDAKNSIDGVQPWRGVFPSIADFISAILDTTAGTRYTEHVTTNLAPAFGRHEGESLYSAIGTYTVKAPVYYTLQEFSHSFARDLLDHLLRPVVKDGRVTGVATARNLEAGEGKDGKTAATEFLKKTTVDYKGPPLQNTNFPRQVARVYELQGAENAAMVHQVALGGFQRIAKGESASDTYLGSLTMLGNDQDAQTLQATVNKQLQLNLASAVPPARVFKDTPLAAVSRFNNKIPEFRRENYGVQSIDGHDIPGKYGQALRACEDFQVRRFREFLRLSLLDMLMGRGDDPIPARSGKVGYTYAFLDELVNVFDYFLLFLSKVRQERETMGLQVDKQARSGRAFESMRRNSSRKFLLFWNHPDAYKSEELYLAAMQEEINVQRDEMLLRAIRETADQMRTISIQARDAMKKWIQYLVTGDAPSGVVGLYGAVNESLDRVKVTHRYDQELQHVQKLVADIAYAQDDAALRKALGSITWEVGATDNRFAISCMLDKTPLSIANGGVLSRNLETFLSLGEAYYSMVPERRKIAVLLAEDEKYRGNGEALATELDRMAEPLLVSASSGLGPEMRSNYIRVASKVGGPNVTDFFMKMKDKLLQLATGAAPGQGTGLSMSLELVDSEDEHKLTMVRSDDMIVSRDFEMWGTCRAEYIRQIQASEILSSGRPGEAARRLHVYPAEENAVEFEAQLRRLNKPYDTFHPRVVMLLEDKEKARQFFQCLAYGFVQECKDPNTMQSSWQLMLPDGSQPIYLTKPVGVSDAKSDIFSVMSRFVLEGSDARPETAGLVDYEAVNQAILERQRALGPEGIAGRMKFEIEEGFVAQWRHRVQEDRQKARKTIQNLPPELLNRRSEEWEDLADLANLMLLSIIDNVQS